MKESYITAILCLQILTGKAQFDNKVDSVFSFYFDIIRNELDNHYPPKDFPNYYDKIIDKNTGDTLFMSKYITEATQFLQQISKIKMPVTPAKLSVTSEILNQWEQWYQKKRSNIIWDSRKNKPKLKS